jgi:hypothetical protein
MSRHAHCSPVTTWLAAGGASSRLQSSALCQLVMLSAEGTVQLLSVLQLSLLEQQAAAAAAAGQWDCGARFGSSIRLLRCSELQLQQGPGAGSPAAGAAAVLRQPPGLAGAQQVGGMGSDRLRLCGPARQLHHLTECRAATAGHPIIIPCSLQAHCMALLPGGQHLQLLAGQHASCIQRTSLSGPPLPPPRRYTCTEYRPASLTAAGAAAVTCLHACPGQPDTFLAGGSDGSISLHRVQQARALLELPGALPAAAVAVRWLPGLRHPGRFLALDARGCLHLFDLSAASPGRLVAAVQLVERGCCALQVAPSAAADEAGGGSAGGQQAQGWAAASFLLGFGSGVVQCHAAGASGHAGGGPARGHSAAAVAATLSALQLRH